MLLSLISIAIAFYWLCLETNGLSVRLLVGPFKVAGLSRAAIHRLADSINWVNKNGDFKGLVVEWIAPLCGWEWVNKHLHDLDSYNPIVEIKAFGIDYKMRFKNPGKKFMRDVFHQVFRGVPKAKRLALA